MDVNRPEVLAEVTEAFARYEQALVTNDLATLDSLFWPDERTVRYGAGEALYGIKAIRAFRAARPAANLARTLDRTVITSFGADFATASTTFSRGDGRRGRQQQSWVRFETGWRIVAAHVSFDQGSALDPLGPRPQTP